jgi:2',3'-cyclic-nucleotide 2'-phosphodiesterase (5'-nucleotidase family)
MKKQSLLLFCCLLTLLACKTAKKTATTTTSDDGQIDITFLQLNDVYEITPMSDGLGGLARVATLRKQLLAENANTITVLSGDFISPSIIGTLRYEGKRIRGKQMVETMNALGVEWVVFGNHEFDYDLEDLQARLNESNFQWLGANARLKTDAGTQPFFKTKAGVPIPCPDNSVIMLQDADGTRLRLGLFGVLLNTGRKPWVVYSDWFEAAQKNYEALKPNTDVCVGLTHLVVADDKKLAAMLPQVPLLMGGHDHDHQIYQVGPVTVAKADANARTVYIHRLKYDKKTGKTTVRSELKNIDATLPDEPTTAAVVAKWEAIKESTLASSGFNAKQKVVTLTTPLDCRETIVRNEQAPFGRIVTDAMLAAARNKPDCAFFNGGSVRIDDILRGDVTELDVIRALPFGGAIVEVTMKGSLLRRTLDAGVQNKGIGGYLQWGRIQPDATHQWLIGGQPLKDDASYNVILPEFLLSGSEQNMAFLKTALQADGKTPDNPGITALYKPVSGDKTDLRNDIRLAIIRFWRGN